MIIMHQSRKINSTLFKTVQNLQADVVSISRIRFKLVARE